LGSDSQQVSVHQSKNCELALDKVKVKIFNFFIKDLMNEIKNIVTGVLLLQNNIHSIVIKNFMFHS